MAYWLVKTEPSSYSFAMLQKEKKTAWTGVKNALARQHLSAMKSGDRVLFYHTGTVRAVVGTAKVIRQAYPDSAGDARAVAVDLQAEKELIRPVTLDQIKSDQRFAGWGLLRMGRLSVVPTSAGQFSAVLELSRSGE